MSKPTKMPCIECPTKCEGAIFVAQVGLACKEAGYMASSATVTCPKDRKTYIASREVSKRSMSNAKKLDSSR